MKFKKSNIILLLIVVVLLILLIYLAKTEKNTSIGHDMKCELTIEVIKLV